jgi:hypothetical protein
MSSSNNLEFFFQTLCFPFICAITQYRAGSFSLNLPPENLEVSHRSLVHYIDLPPLSQIVIHHQTT